MRVRYQVPRNISSYFIFGLVAAAFSGFWTGGAYEQNQRARADAAVFMRGTSRAPGIVYTSYQNGKRNRWNVTYTFKTPSGQVFDGTYKSDTNVNPGTPIRVAYAINDPSVSHEPTHRSPRDLPPPMEWFGLGMGVLVTFLMAKFAFNQVGASGKIRGAFVALAFVAYGLGLFGGLSTMQSRYTVQFGDMAWSSMSFYDTRRYMGVDLKLDDDGLYVDGQRYGQVPNHGHVWIRPDGVFVNGQKR